MDNDIDLSALRAFRAVVREGAFSAAAAALRIPKSTLSKRVADLEADLGVRLIERTTRQLRITTEGEVLAARADRLLGDAEDIRRSIALSGSAPRGHLRVAVPNLLGQLLMGRIAAKFRGLHPDITLECHFLDRAPDLLEEGFDGVLRFGPLEDSAQMARLITHGYAVVVAPAHDPRFDDLTHPHALLSLPLVGLAAPWAGAWKLVNNAEEPLDLEAKPALLLGSMLAVRDAVVAGAGATLLPSILAEPAIASGQLTRILPNWSGARKPMYFVYPSAQSITARLRVFIDFIAIELKALDTTQH